MISEALSSPLPVPTSSAPRPANENDVPLASSGTEVITASEPAEPAEEPFEDSDATEQEAARPATRRRLDLALSWSRASIAVVSFSLTFVAGGVALLAGLLPLSLTAVDASVDLGVLMLMVPVCALVLTMLVEVARTALSGLPRVQPQRPVPALSNWHGTSRR